MKQGKRKKKNLITFPDSRKGRVCGVLWTACVLLVASLAIGIMSLYFGAVKYGWDMFVSYFKVDMLVLLNLLPVVLITFLLWFITGRAGLSFGLTTAVVMTLTMVNVIMIKLRNDPLMMEDLMLISEAGGVAGDYNLALTKGKILGIVIAIVMVVLVSLLTHSFHMRIREGWGKFRLLMTVLLAVVMGLLWNHVYLSTRVYEATINHYGINHYSAVDEFQSRGFVYPFLYSYKKAIDTAPDGYDKSEAAAVMDSYEDADMDDDEKVNVIAVMLEAYADLSRLTDNEAIAEVYEPLHEIEAQSISGGVVTNVFAGGTVMTERSFLTGYTSLGNFRTASNSYVRYFASQGYTVEGSHPGYAWFYNRSNANENLGFENYYFYENYYCDTAVNKDTLIRDSDVVFFEEIVDLMQESIEEDGNPYFSFNVSYQNHGPYDTDSLFREDEVYVTSEETGWSEESCNILNNYLAGVADTTEQIAETLERLEEYDEPVVFIAFGDHLPWLGDSNSVYTEVGMNISTDTTEGYLNHYTTPFFIWANSAAKEALDSDFTGEAGDVSPNFLMNELFEACGWEGSAFLQYTDTVREVSSVTTSSGAYLIDGEITQDVSDEEQEIFDLYDCVQYYWRRNFQGS